MRSTSVLTNPLTYFALAASLIIASYDGSANTSAVAHSLNQSYARTNTALTVNRAGKGDKLTIQPGNETDPISARSPKTMIVDAQSIKIASLHP